MRVGAVITIVAEHDARNAAPQPTATVPGGSRRARIPPCGADPAYQGKTPCPNRKRHDALLSSGHRARLLGGSLRLVAPSPQVARVLSAAGVSRHLDIFATIRAAITGQPELPEPMVAPAAVPARGQRADDVNAGGATSKTSAACGPFGERATRCSRGLPTGRGGL
jgi:hypothetical protein